MVIMIAGVAAAVVATVLVVAAFARQFQRVLHAARARQNIWVVCVGIPANFTAVAREFQDTMSPNRRRPSCTPLPNAFGRQGSGGDRRRSDPSQETVVSPKRYALSISALHSH